MIAVGLQSVLAVAMIAAAGFYLGVCAWRYVRRGAPGSCCAQGCGGTVRANREEREPSGGSVFIPLENLQDAARRRSREREAQGGAGQP